MCCNQYSMCDLHLTLCHSLLVLRNRSLTLCRNSSILCDLHLTLCHNHIVLCDRSLTLCHNQIVLHDFPVHLITILVFCLIFSGLCDGSALCYNYNPITPSGFGLHFKIRFLQSCHPVGVLIVYKLYSPN